MRQHDLWGGGGERKSIYALFQRPCLLEIPREMAKSDRDTNRLLKAMSPKIFTSCVCECVSCALCTKCLLHMEYPTTCLKANWQQ